MSEYPEELVEIEGRILLQTRLLMPQGNYAANNIFPILINDVQHKLKAILYHKSNYLMIENKAIEDSIQQHSTKARIPGILFFEFEAFLFQTKSTLDITIKILNHLFPNIFRINTFENKGQKLIKNLEEHKKKLCKQLANKIDDKARLEIAIKYRCSTIDLIIETLESERSTWLCKAIETRDTISHYKGSFNLEEYTLEKKGDDVLITLPKILGVYPREFIDLTYQSCIEFIQDFICLFIELWLPPFFAITQASDSDPLLADWRANNVRPAKYIKYTLASRELI